MKHNLLAQSPFQQKASQSHVHQRLQPGVIADKIHAADAARGNQRPRCLSVIDQQIIPRRTTQIVFGAGGEDDIAQVGAIAPQAAVQQGDKVFPFVSGRSRQHSRQYPHGISTLQHSPLPGLERIVSLPVTRLEIAGRLQQPPVEIALGKVPGDIQPGAAPMFLPRLVPGCHVGRVFDQRLHGAARDFVAQGAQCRDNLSRVFVLGDDICNDRGQAVKDSVPGE